MVMLILVFRTISVIRTIHLSEHLRTTSRPKGSDNRGCTVIKSPINFLVTLIYGGLLRTILSKHIFMGKVQEFHGQTQISMTKNRTFHSQHIIFIVKIRYTLANIFMGKVQHFHGQTCYITTCVCVASGDVQ